MKKIISLILIICISACAPEPTKELKQQIIQESCTEMQDEWMDYFDKKEIMMSAWKKLDMIPALVPDSSELEIIIGDGIDTCRKLFSDNMSEEGINIEKILETNMASTYLYCPLINGPNDLLWFDARFYLVELNTLYDKHFDETVYFGGEDPSSNTSSINWGYPFNDFEVSHSPTPSKDVSKYKNGIYYYQKPMDIYETVYEEKVIDIRRTNESICINRESLVLSKQAVCINSMELYSRHLYQCEILDSKNEYNKFKKLIEDKLDIYIKYRQDEAIENAESVSKNKI